jgi:hypothetical protein
MGGLEVAAASLVVFKGAGVEFSASAAPTNLTFSFVAFDLLRIPNKPHDL